MICLFGGRKEAIVPRVQLQPVAPHDVVIHHVSEDEGQLGFEDLVVEQVLIAIRLGLRTRLRAGSEQLFFLPLPIILKLGRSGSLLGVKNVEENKTLNTSRASVTSFGNCMITFM